VVDRYKWPVRRSGWMPALAVDAADERPEWMPLNTYTDDVTSSVHPNVLRAWCAYSRAHGPLFPNLSHVRWAITDASEVDLVSLFLGPSLSGLTLLGAVAHALAIPVIHEAMRRSSSLRSLNILKTGIPLPTIDTSIGCKLHYLREFRCSDVTPNTVVRHIASLPYLESFEAGVLADLTLEGLPHPFPVVRELRLRQATLDHLCLLLPSVCSSYIHTLELGAGGDADVGGPGTLLRAVAAHPSSGSLRALLLTSGSRTPHSTRHSPILTAEDIWPLMGLPRLRHVALGDYSVNYADGFLPRMLHAWPELEVLSADKPNTIIALDDFLDVARTHPLLRSFDGLFVSLHHMPSGPPKFVHHALADVRFLGRVESAGDLAMLARLLATTFPNLNLDCLHHDLKRLISKKRQAHTVVLAASKTPITS
jgi:hypothetical protein